MFSSSKFTEFSDGNIKKYFCTKQYFLEGRLQKKKLL